VKKEDHLFDEKETLQAYFLEYITLQEYLNGHKSYGLWQYLFTVNILDVNVLFLKSYI